MTTKTKLVKRQSSVLLLPERDIDKSPVLECVGLGVTFGGLKAVEDFDLTIGRTEIAGLIGPNGAGKSNIGDAMRWVMGEQSSKALRGEKMAGVIFHGTQTRPKAPFAQVTITIDNEDGALEYDSDTVSVSRKLYRNGDSFYMINGKEVNLKDIV